MFKVKENRIHRRQYQQPTDSFSITLKNSSRKSSHNQLQLPLCSSIILGKKMQSIQLKSKTQSIQVTTKKQEYFQTEQQMIENHRKQLHFDIKDYQQRLLIYEDNPHQNSNKRIKKLCLWFVSQMKKNLRPNNIEQIEQILQQFNEKRIETKNQSRIQKLSQVFWNLQLMVEFLMFTLCFAFSHFSQYYFFVSLHFISFLLFILKQAFKHSLEDHFSFKEFIMKNTFHKLFFLVNILSIILWFNSQYIYISLLSAIFCLLCFQAVDILKNVIISIAFRLRIWVLFQHFLIVKIMIKMITFSFIVCIILNKLYFSNQTQNWMSRSRDKSMLKDCQIFLISFTQSISIVFSFGIYMPFSVNTLESVLFSIIRIATFLLNLINLKDSFDYNNKKNVNYRISIFKDISLTPNLSKEYYNQILHLLENQFHQNDHLKQNQDQNLSQYLPKSTLKKVVSYKYREQFDILTKNFSFMLCSTKIKLAQSMKLQFYSKNQIIKDFNKSYDFFILKEGQIAHFSNIRSRFLTGIQKSRKGQLLQLNNSFMTKKFPNYQLKCLTFSKIYRLQQQSLRMIIRQNKADFQYLWLTHDSQTSLTEQFQFLHCKACQRKHSDFDCHKIHYIPLKSQIVCRYLIRKHSFKNNNIFRQQRIPRLKISTLKFYPINLSQFNQKHSQRMNIQGQTNEQINFKDKQQIYNFFEQITQRAYLKQKQQQMQQDQIWNLKSDILCDFKYYFKFYNPQNLKKCILGSICDIL